MNLTTNEQTMLLSVITFFMSAFLSVLLWVLNKGVSKMESISSSLTNMESDVKVLINDHVNLKDGVKDIDTRLKLIENKRK